MTDKNFLDLRIPPPVVFLVFAGIAWLISKQLPAAGFDFPHKNCVAAAIAVVSAFFAAPAILSFLRAGTTVHPENPGRTTKLVVSGVYRITRNPMYLSLLFLLAAWGIFLSNLASFAPILFFVAYLTRFQITPEETALRSLFGTEYEAYCKRVRRWL